MVLIGTFGTSVSGLIEVVADSVGVCRSGMVVTRCNDCAILSNYFFVMSPASRFIIVEEGGFVNIEIMSKAACFKNNLFRPLGREPPWV